MDAENTSGGDGKNTGGSSLPEDLANKLDRLVASHFAEKEREAAWELIRDHYNMLPQELQDLYSDVQDLYGQGRFEDASALFEQWLDEARDLGLI
ncbi:MAG TPA: hypothetical protein VMT46_02555 [Anaerolineaceae bacterium]|nr:hypothetical protein [Anaerolineaceae bacterium]